jgi:hypothetical protein
VGKTTIALGLLAAFKERGLRCQFFKPVGQHFADREGHRADEDAWLCRDVLASDVDAELMSPVIVPAGYVSQYLEHPEPERLRLRILDAASRLQRNVDLLVIEGTGHAGVGSCLDLSNAVVAHMLNAMVLMVIPGGVGRSLDELALNLALFQMHGVPVLGAVANKVYGEKFDKVVQSLTLGTERLGTRLLGAIRHEPQLTYPTVGQLREELGARVLCGEGALGRIVANTLIAAMTPQNVLLRVQQDALVITPGDRVDNILVAMSADMMGRRPSGNIAGIVLTGGLVPATAVMPLLKKSGLPVLLCNEDTFEVTTRIAQHVFKINPGDTEKIAAAQRFVRTCVDVEAILARVSQDG